MSGLMLDDRASVAEQKVGRMGTDLEEIGKVA
jgi:hypothetical protein